MTHWMAFLVVAIPALPLLATLVTALLGRGVLKERSHLPVVAALVTSFVLSLLLLVLVGLQSPAGVGWEATTNLWTWVSVDEALRTPPAARVAIGTGAAAMSLPERLPFTVDLALRADALTAIMLSLVTFVASLVAIYSAAYMHGERGYWRYFTYIGLFVFSMTMLVSVSNFVLLYVFWEAVGLCSYLLIGFWYEKPAAAAAGKKAFLVNRVGDFGFALGLFLIWTTYGTLNFHDAGGVAGVLGQTRLATPDAFVGGGTATAICLLLLLGACGKSAQFPLHVWLPDAMEGPSPVSALIHAATMVTAGVYMVARATPLFMASSDSQHVVALVGCATAAIGGVIALTQTDLKRVLAYSTISQLGYMFLALGAGTAASITAGMFHLFTHAFFKALLFLAAGSVMHAMGNVIDMRRFGGLRRLMPITHATFLVGALALVGLFPFAGFWSKDAILAAAMEKGAESTLFSLLYLVGMVVAFLTSVYTFRALFLTFYGRELVPEEAGHHAHESPPTMTWPLVILAVLSLVIGGVLSLTGWFASYLGHAPSLAFAAAHAVEVESEGGHLLVAALSTLVVLAGLVVAWFLYLPNAARADVLARLLEPFYVLSYRKLFFDPLYDWAIVRPLEMLARLCYWLDRNLVDGLVNLVGGLPPAVAAGLRSLQTGMVQFYALAMVWGLLVLIATLLIWPALVAQGH